MGPRLLLMVGREAAYRVARYSSRALGVQRVGIKGEAFYWFHMVGVYFGNAAQCNWGPLFAYFKPLDNLEAVKKVWQGRWGGKGWRRGRKGKRRLEEGRGRRKRWTSVVYLDGRRNCPLPLASSYRTTEWDAISWQSQLLFICLVLGYCSECYCQQHLCPSTKYQLFKKIYISALPAVVSFQYSPSCNFCNCSFVSKNSSSN